jgi:peptidyl-prolyl cis-trans isomerase SurA
VPLYITLSFWCALTVGAEIIDRIVAVVEGQIITLSDLRKERQIRAVLREKPVDDDQVLRKELIDTKLIELQIISSPTIDVSNEEIDEEIQQLNPPPGIDPQALRNAVRQRIQIQKFFDTRFGQLIRPSEDDIRKYYEEVFVPEAQKRGLAAIPPLTDPMMANAIRENVIQERLDRDVEAWLETIRRRSNIEIFQ